MSDILERLKQETTLPVVLDFPDDFDPVRQGSLQVMDAAAGDYKVIWDRDDRDLVDEARATFERLKKKGYIAYKVEGDGSKGEIIHEFDPDAEKLIMSPPLMGG